MHPVWVIRASRTAFALRPNRESTSNICHKRPLSTVIFQPLFHPLLSTLIPFIHNPRLRPAAGPSPTDPTILYEAFFTDLAARLEESAHLATVLRLSLRRSSLSNSFSPGTGWPLQPSHILKFTNSRISGFLPASQRNGDESTVKMPLLLPLSRFRPQLPRSHSEHICGRRRRARPSHSLASHSTD
jgi:hypothetical protein